MDKRIAALLSTVAGVAVMGSAQAATPAAAPSQGQASSYADLLSPIPNAVEALKADDAAKAQQKGEGEVELAQYYPYYGYGSGSYYGYGYRRHHHHHHHHQQNWGWRPY